MMTKNPDIVADRPLDPTSGELDRLGFHPLAERLADAIISDASADGLVMGIEGSWGSGKSSLTALTKHALAARSDEQRPVVIDFRPWLIGNRDALLAALFGELQKAVDAIDLRQGDATAGSVTAANKAGQSLKAFAARLEPLGSVVALGASINPLFAVVAALMTASSRAAKEASKGPTLTKLKSRLDDALEKLPVKIVVVIDDVDRLEPAEVIELLRLVRSVADFKNIIYVMCYDPAVLAEAVRVGTQMDDGRAYLEKIVQVSIPVPSPEPFLLRRWFEDALQKLLLPITDQGAARLARVIDNEGGRRLKTPRDVVRALNAVRFAWTALRGKVDAADLVWLQLVRISSPQLYRWIESYVAATCSLRGSRASITDDAKAHALTSLAAAAAGDYRSVATILSDMSEHLLGIVPFAEGEIYSHIQDLEWHSAINGNRLASPDHYRLYFALDLPLMALTATEQDTYNDAASTAPERVGTLLTGMLSQRDPSGITKAETLLERLLAKSLTGFGSLEARNLVLAFSNVMDELAERTDENGWLGSGGWRSGQRLLPSLIKALDPSERETTISRMFTDGEAIGWLTSIFRDEYFAHGLVGSPRRSRDGWLFTEQELDHISTIMIRRYTAMGLEGLVGTLRPASSLFAWKQMGQSSFEPVLQNALASDEKLVVLLGLLASRVTSTSGNYTHISDDTMIGLGLVPHEIAARLQRIASENETSLAGEAKHIYGLLESVQGD